MSTFFSTFFCTCIFLSSTYFAHISRMFVASLSSLPPTKFFEKTEMSYRYRQRCCLPFHLGATCQVHFRFISFDRFLLLVGGRFPVKTPLMAEEAKLDSDKHWKSKK